jgi:hypothetical protein
MFRNPATHLYYTVYILSKLHQLKFAMLLGVYVQLYMYLGIIHRVQLLPINK